MAAAVVFLALLAISPPAFAQVTAEGEISASVTEWRRSLQAEESGFDKGADQLLLSGRARLNWSASHSINAVLALEGRAGFEVEERVGITEAYISGNRGEPLGSLRIKAGLFFLPTSQEHLPAVWSPRTTLHPSFLNGWIGEEVRPLGVDVQRTFVTPRFDLVYGTTIFGGNDTMGTLLAWRGWSATPMLPQLGEDVRLPPLVTLPNFFPRQRESVTPIADELDGRIGYSARIGANGDSSRLLVTYVDNNGDRRLHGDQYAWATRFVLAGAGMNVGRVAIAAEHLEGRTGMGDRARAHVDAAFRATYLSASIAVKPGLIVTGRLERFSLADDDRSGAEENTETGSAATLAVALRMNHYLDAIAEVSRAEGKNDLAEISGEGLDVGGIRTTAGIRGRF